MIISKHLAKSHIRLFSTVVKTFNESFQYDFVEHNDLTESEKAVFSITDKILKEFDFKFKKEQIFISNCLQPDFPIESFGGIWEPFENRIIILRDMLCDRSTYAVKHNIGNSAFWLRAFLEQLNRDYFGYCVNLQKGI